MTSLFPIKLFFSPNEHKTYYKFNKEIPDELRFANIESFRSFDIDGTLPKH